MWTAARSNYDRKQSPISDVFRTSIHRYLMESRNNILTVSGDLLSKPILTKCLLMRPDDGEGDSHAEVFSAVYHLAERYNFVLSVVYLEHYFGSCRVCPHRALI